MADFDTSRKNVKSVRVKIEDRTFQIEFWNDCQFGLPYASVSEIVTKEVKPYPFSRKRIVKEVEENIDYGWMEVNRLDWALNRIAQYLQREKDKIREIQNNKVIQVLYVSSLVLLFGSMILGDLVRNFLSFLPSSTITLFSLFLILIDLTFREILANKILEKMLKKEKEKSEASNGQAENGNP